MFVIPRFHCFFGYVLVKVKVMFSVPQSFVSSRVFWFNVMALRHFIFIVVSGGVAFVVNKVVGIVLLSVRVRRGVQIDCTVFKFSLVGLQPSL
jgi:hypothetical protein